MWDFITCNISTINGIILFLTLLVIIWYTWETRKTRLSNEKNISLLEAQNHRTIEQENKKNKLTHSYILSQLETLQIATQKQAEKVNEYIEQLKQEKTINLDFTFVVGFNTKSIRIIPPPEIFDLYVLSAEENNTAHLEDFNTLLKQLDLIDGLADSFVSSFEYSQKHFSIYEDKWNENIEVIRDLHDKWITALTSQDKDPRDDPFLKEFIEIYHRNAQIENYRDMYISERSLINPTLEKARTLQPNLYGELLLTPLLKCLDAINNHRNLRQVKIQEYEIYKSQLNNISKSLSTIKSNLSTFQISTVNKWETKRV